MKQMDDNIGYVLEISQGHRPTRTTPSSSSPPTMGRGYQLSRWRRHAVQGQKGEVWEGGHRVPALFAGRGTSSRARSITSYSPRSTGSPFEQAVGIDPKSAMSTGGALAAPVTAFQYDWNMLPIGQQLWLEHLES